MTTSEHLQRIKAKCESLLELAAKRTPGKWIRTSNLATHIICASSENAGNLVCDCPDSSPDGDHFDRDATFIASCAGPAEAGWRATIAAIDGFQRLSKWNFPGWEGDHGIISEIEGEIDAILAAWPEEIL